MVFRTFLDKCTTIIKDSEENMGLYPVVMLNHGSITTRGLIHFNIDNLKKQYEDKIFIDISKLKHTLKMTNCGSINERTFSNIIHSNDANGFKKRATSFDILLFKVPKKWDEGVGFDYASDVWFNGDTALSFDACNWYQASNGIEWDEEGIFSTDNMSKEYDKFSRGEESIILSRQHFDHGNENLEIDITDYVNSLITSNKTNYGLGLCFTPFTEDSAITVTKYVGFFSNKTNTFFEPYIESRYDSSISDDRYNFILGKTNKLYFYAFSGGILINLDNLPSCTIDGVEYPVKQETKGVYYAEIKLSKENYSKDQILTDIWGNLSYNGEEIDDIEQEFVTKSNSSMLSMTSKINTAYNYTVSINGMDDYEKITSNDVRIMTVVFRKKYTTDEYDVIRNTKYRLYVKNGDKEVDVIDWDNINSTYDTNYFYIDTNTLLPNDYHIDIKMECNGGVKVFRDELKFTIVSNITNEKK